MHEDKRTECKHYTSLCMIVTSCCNKKYPCRICHDDSEAHKLDLDAVQNMVCLSCGKTQEINSICVHCNKQMSKYFCKTCKLWSDREDDIYHCSKCKVCRIGNSETIYHCDKCDACMDIRLKDNHTHIEGNLRSDCPICTEYLFYSTRDVLFLKCGHAMHMDCFEYYLKMSYQCPLCQKSTGEAETLDLKIDYILKNTSKLQGESKNWICEIMCYDCRSSSVTNYRYLFNKCTLCNSYNTRIGDIQKKTRVNK